MKLLLILAAVLVVWFLLKKRGPATVAAAGSGPNELEYLNEADQPADPPSPTDPGTALDSYSINLPGFDFVYHGDPNYFPNITGPDGVEVAIAGARPN